MKKRIVSLLLVFIFVLPIFNFLGCDDDKKSKLEVIQNFKTEYVQNQSLDVSGGKIKYTSESGESEEYNITEDMISGFSTTNVGNFSLTITFRDAVIYLPYSVTEKWYPKLEIINTFKTQYVQNQSLDISGGKIKYTDDNGNSSVITVTNVMISDFSTENVGEFTLKITYSGLEIEIAYSVSPYVEPDGLFVSQSFKKTYIIGESLYINNEKLKVVENSQTSYIDITSSMIQGFDTTSVGQKNMIITYNEQTLTVPYIVSYPYNVGDLYYYCYNDVYYFDMGGIVFENESKIKLFVLNSFLPTQSNLQTSINSGVSYNLTYIYDQQGQFSTMYIIGEDVKIEFVVNGDVLQRLQYNRQDTGWSDVVVTLSYKKISNEINFESLNNFFNSIYANNQDGQIIKASNNGNVKFYNNQNDFQDENYFLNITISGLKIVDNSIFYYISNGFSTSADMPKFNIVKNQNYTFAFKVSQSSVVFAVLDESNNNVFSKIFYAV